jgi:Flp pilus assembly protein TadB
MIAVAGALAVGLAVFVVMTTHIEPRVLRPAVRRRLDPQHTATQGDATPPHPLELAALLEAVARAMQSGSSASHALIHVADSHAALTPFTEPIVLRCMNGLSLTHAIDEAWSATWSTEVQHAARALALASLNNSHAVVLHGATLIRERVTLLEERTTRSAQAQSSLRILTLSPLIVAALVMLMSANARQFIVTTTTGLACTAIGLGLHVVGRRWMHTLIARAAP